MTYCIKIISLLLIIVINTHGAENIIEKPRFPLLGHNLGPTTYTYKEKQVSVGYYALAYGITDSLTIGMSPWLFYFYNMPSLTLKYASKLEGFVDRVSLDFNYFHTIEMFENLFTQRSVYSRLTGSHLFNEFYTLHTSAGFQYFFNDERPFSLRLFSRNDTRVNLSLSSLHEISLLPWFGILLEVGMLGLNYGTPYLHLGASINFKWGWGYFQIGYSRSSSLGTVPYGRTNKAVDGVHPETQLQFLF